MSRRVRLVVVAGLACVMVGLLLALLGDADLLQAGAGSEPLGWSLLILGIAGGAGVTGFVLGARQRSGPA